MKREPRQRFVWIEDYSQCGCSADAPFKSELLGYCEKHGNNRKNIYKVPLKQIEAGARAALSEGDEKR